MWLDAEHSSVLTMQQLQNFRQHAKFKEMFTAEAQEQCTSTTEAGAHFWMALAHYVASLAASF